MKVYVVSKEAVYRHEMGGVFSTLEKAKEAAQAIAEGESDDHHEIVVVPFTLDERIPHAPLGDYAFATLDEPDHIFGVRGAPGEQ